MDYSSITKLKIQHRLLSLKFFIKNDADNTTVGFVHPRFAPLRELPVYTDASAQNELVHIRKRVEVAGPRVFDIYGANNGPLLAMVRLTTYSPGRYLTRARIDLFDAQGAAIGYIQETTAGINKVLRLFRNIFVLGPLLYGIAAPFILLRYEFFQTPNGGEPVAAGSITYRRGFFKRTLTLDMTAAQARLSPEITIGACSLLSVLFTTAIA